MVLADLVVQADLVDHSDQEVLVVVVVQEVQEDLVGHSVQVDQVVQVDQMDLLYKVVLAILVPLGDPVVLRGLVVLEDLVD